MKEGDNQTKYVLENERTMTKEEYIKKLNDIVAKLEDLKVETQDPLEEVNLITEAAPRVIYISGLLEPNFEKEIIESLYKYKG